MSCKEGKSLNDYGKELNDIDKRRQEGEKMGPASRGERSKYILSLYEPDPMNWGVGDHQLNMTLKITKKEATLLADNIKRLVDEP